MVETGDLQWDSLNESQPRDGVVDLAEDAPTSESYGVVSQMGFVWSMTASETKTDHPRMFAWFGAECLTLDLTVRVSDGTLRQRLIRRTMLPGVRRGEVCNEGLVGVCFLPKNATNLPSIIFLSGSRGGRDETTAVLLSSEGHTPFLRVTGHRSAIAYCTSKVRVLSLTS